MNFFKWLFGKNEKLWKVGDHRVKSKTTYRQVNLDGPPWTDTVPSGNVFKCVDCEKQADDRETFKDEVCYEIIDG